MTWACLLPGQRRRRMRDSNSRGVAPNTLSKYAPWRSGPAGPVRDLGTVLARGLRGRPRTRANETTNETEAQAQGLTPVSRSARSCQASHETHWRRSMMAGAQLSVPPGNGHRWIFNAGNAGWTNHPLQARADGSDCGAEPMSREPSG